MAEKHDKQGATHDYWADPEVQERRRSYAEFLAGHPLVQAVRENDQEKFEKVLEELGLEL
jgi:hypothetical protein